MLKYCENRTAKPVGENRPVHDSHHSARHIRREAEKWAEPMNRPLYPGLYIHTLPTVDSFISEQTPRCTHRTGVQGDFTTDGSRVHSSQLTDIYWSSLGMADTSCLSSIGGQVFDDQIVPDQDDCFLVPTSENLPHISPWQVSMTAV